MPKNKKSKPKKKSSKAVPKQSKSDLEVEVLEPKFKEEPKLKKELDEDEQLELQQNFIEDFGTLNLPKVSEPIFQQLRTSQRDNLERDLEFVSNPSSEKNKKNYESGNYEISNYGESGNYEEMGEKKKEVNYSESSKTPEYFGLKEKKEQEKKEREKLRGY